MKINKLSQIIILFLIGYVTLSGCASAPTLQPTAIPQPTITILPPTVTMTVAPTATETIAPTVTVTVVPTADLSGISVLGAGPSNGFYLVNFFKPGIDKKYLVQTESGIPFSCEIYPAYPDRLICYGPMMGWGEKVKFNFIDMDTAQTVYQLDFILPDRDWGFEERLPFMCLDPDACPERGQKKTCETEFRRDSKGQLCIIGTCFDACGFCTGVNTCDNE